MCVKQSTVLKDEPLLDSKIILESYIMYLTNLGHTLDYRTAMYARLHRLGSCIVQK